MSRVLFFKKEKKEPPRVVLEQCFLKWGPLISSITLTWELAKMQILGPVSDLLIRNSGDGAQQSVLSSLPGDSGTRASRILGFFHLFHIKNNLLSTYMSWAS